MSEFLPEEVRRGLEAAQAAALRRSNRLCLHVGDQVHRVIRLWEGGVALAAGDAPPIRGYVDLFDGPRHLASCLIVAAPEDQGPERIYEFKTHTPASDSPPLDFERADPRPSALIPPPF